MFIRFVDPAAVTPRTLEAALEIKEIGKEHEEDLFEDMDLGAWIFLLYFICHVVSSVVYPFFILMQGPNKQ
jgi:hypothetical protein